MSPGANPATRLSERTLVAVALAVAVLVVLAFARDAASILRYPWDWSPDEGLAIDYARRVLDAPQTLYTRTVVPFPLAYNPLLPLLLAPLVRSTDAPLLPARLLALAWTLATAVAVYRLVRKRARPVLALLSVALVLAPGDLSFWHLLVRFDGLMIALWLGAAVLLLPARLERGADELSGKRLAGGTILLLAAVLAKPTAIVHGAPLALGWFLVDRRSAWRLVVALAVGGIATFLLLQLASGGAYLWVMSLWGVHPRKPGLLEGLLATFLIGNAGFLLFTVAALFAASLSGGSAWRDSGWLLLLGGALIFPALAKAGAWLNYFVPFFCALVVLAGRLWGGTPRVGALLGSVLALGTLATRPFPLPSPEDEATARAFYDTVRERGRPLLATRPEYAYVLVHQPVEAEGSSLTFRVAAHVPGTETLLERIQSRHYRLVVAVSYFWPNDRDFEDALVTAYEFAGVCRLGYFYGQTEFVLLFPRGSGARFIPPAGTRCRSLPPGPEVEARPSP